MQVWITGDTHRDFTRFNKSKWSAGYELTKEDIVIILGDFGGVWNKMSQDTDRKLRKGDLFDVAGALSDKTLLDLFDEVPWTTVFVHGNHDNIPQIQEYPLVDFHGGRAYKIRESLYCLQNGDIFNFGGETFFAFGGARSTDIDGGILDPNEYCNWNDFIKVYEFWCQNNPKNFRVKGYSWWEEEIPDETARLCGLDNLKQHDWKVDHILTHGTSTVMAATISAGRYKADTLTDYLQEVYEKTSYKYAWCGHYHTERVEYGNNGKHIFKFEKIERVV